MKVEYNEWDGALGPSKIQVRWRLDTSKMKVEYNERGWCPSVR